MKFHVSPDGRVNRCSAKLPESCKYYNRESNASSPHFATATEATLYAETKLTQKHGLTSNLAKTPKEKKETIMNLNQIMDIELLRKMLNGSYVGASRHQEDDTLRILSYGPKAQYEGKWNDVTKQARGLIVQTSSDSYEDAIIIQRPWRKFFTLQQIDSGWHLGDEENMESGDIELSNLDFNAPAEVTDKMDGSLGIMYRTPSGLIAMSTKGSFHSNQAKMYSEFLSENELMYETAEKLMQENPDTTFLYELVGPNNQIVLTYDTTDISFLGAVNKTTGYSSSPNDYKVWSEAGLAVTETMPAKTLNEALKLPARENREGLVVRMLSEDPKRQHQIKIKQEDYLRMHRIVAQVESVSGIRENLRNSNLNFNELREISETGNILKMPEINQEISLLRDNGLNELAVKREEKYKEYLVDPVKKYVEIYDKVMKMPESDFTGDNAMKNLALGYKGPSSEKSVYFGFYKNRLEGTTPSSKQIQTFFQRVAKDIKGDQ